MKKTQILKTLLITLTPVLLLAACTSKPAKKTENHEGHEIMAEKKEYTCSMHPEVVSDKPGKCPKCGMDLVPKEETASASNKYRMAYKVSSPNVEAGKEVEFTFTPQIEGKESEAVPLDVSHDKKIHLIIVNDQLSYFLHLHPEYAADGSYKVKTTFPAGGNYVLYADYTPTGATGQLQKIDMKVNGKPTVAVNYSTPKLSSSADGFTLTLTPENGKFMSKAPIHITVIVKQGTKEIPADQLDDYLGAKAHMVIIGVEDKDFLHVHPEVEDGKLDLHTTFNKPGIYRGWVQFQTAGKVHTTDYVIKVEQGKAMNDDKMDMEHGEEHKH